jgi:hypothetical protein
MGLQGYISKLYSSMTLLWRLNLMAYVFPFEMWKAFYDLQARERNLNKNRSFDLGAL